MGLLFIYMTLRSRYVLAEEGVMLSMFDRILTLSSTEPRRPCFRELTHEPQSANYAEYLSAQNNL